MMHCSSLSTSLQSSATKTSCRSPHATNGTHRPATTAVLLLGAAQHEDQATMGADCRWDRVKFDCSDSCWILYPHPRSNTLLTDVHYQKSWSTGSSSFASVHKRTPCMLVCINNTLGINNIFFTHFSWTPVGALDTAATAQVAMCHAHQWVIRLCH